ncbi:hypothetical protein VIGAN_10230900, partial [Vigna angularis var. angularis]
MRSQGKEVAYNSAYHRNKHRFQKTTEAAFGLIHCYQDVVHYAEAERHELPLNLTAPKVCKQVAHNRAGSSYCFYKNQQINQISSNN